MSQGLRPGARGATLGPVVTSRETLRRGPDGGSCGGAAAVAVRALAKQYGGRWLFGGLDLRCEAGACLAVTGPNGSGKSTLLRILAGLTPPGRGTVRFELAGRSLAPAAARAHLGMVAPDHALYEELTGCENLQFFSRLRGLEPDRAELASALERVGLEGRGGDLVRAYSTGMRQRLRLACAVAHEPAFLLMDEPGAHLDEAGRALVAAAIASVRQRGGIAVLATNVEREARHGDQTLRLGA